MASQTNWTPEMDKVLPTIYPEYPSSECAAILSKQFGVAISRMVVLNHAKKLGIPIRARGFSGFRNPLDRTQPKNTIVSDVLFKDSKPHHCRYIVVGTPDSPICGKDIVKGSYCAYHYEITHDGSGSKMRVRKDMNEGVKV